MANRPIKKFRSGQLEAAVWFNEREVKDTIVGFKTVSLTKSWKDDQDMWRNSTIQLRKNDIPKVILLMQKVQEELLLTHEEKEEGDENE